MLEKQPAGDMARIAHVRHRQPHERRYLLGLAEIMLGRIRKAFALQRDDALIALAGERLIEGEGEITLAEHVAKARLLVQHREPVRVVAYIATHRPCLIIAHPQVDPAPPPPPLTDRKSAG